MPKVKMKQRKGNVYQYTRETTATPRTNAGSGDEVKPPFMEQHSQENVDLWWGIFTEIGNECTR